MVIRAATNILNDVDGLTATIALIRALRRYLYHWNARLATRLNLPPLIPPDSDAYVDVLACDSGSVPGRRCEAVADGSCTPSPAFFCYNGSDKRVTGGKAGNVTPLLSPSKALKSLLYV